MRKQVFCEIYTACYAYPDDYNSKDWWDRNFIVVIEDLLREKRVSKEKLTAFEESKICKEDKTNTLYRLAVNQYVLDCKKYDTKILGAAKEYMEAVQRIESNHKTL